MKKSLITFLATLVGLFALINSLQAAVVLDNFAEIYDGADPDGGAASFTVNTASSNDLFVVGFMYRAGSGSLSDSFLTGVSWNGQAMTRDIYIQPDRAFEVWYLDNPNQGTGELTFTGGDISHVSAIGLSLDNVASFTRLDTFNDPASDNPALSGTTSASASALFGFTGAARAHDIDTGTTADADLGTEESNIANASGAYTLGISGSTSYSFQTDIKTWMNGAGALYEVVAVPEPSAAALLLGTLGVFALTRRRRYS